MEFNWHRNYWLECYQYYLCHNFPGIYCLPFLPVVPMSNRLRGPTITDWLSDRLWYTNTWPQSSWKNIGSKVMTICAVNSISNAINMMLEKSWLTFWGILRGKGCLCSSPQLIPGGELQLICNSEMCAYFRSDITHIFVELFPIPIVNHFTDIAVTSWATNYLKQSHKNILQSSTQ